MTGHIRRRGEKSWELKFDLGRDPLTRKRQIRYHSFKGTKRAAEKKLTELMAAADNGDYVDPSRTTLAEFLDRWDRDWAVTNLSPKTLERYREIAATHIRPHLGAAQLQKLKPVHFAELYAKLQRDSRERVSVDGRKTIMPPISARTTGHVHRLLHRALGHAVTWGLLIRNPVSAVTPPKVEAAEIEILDEGQARDVLAKLRGRAIYLPSAVALATGMRRGEILALRWRDVDLDAATIRVERSLEQTKAGLRFKAPKTKFGRRTIAISPSLVAELRSQWKIAQELRLALGLGKAPDDALVFAKSDGSPTPPNSLTKEWGRVSRELKLPPVSFHALRHTHASQLIDSGMNVLTISRRLGHGSPTITLGVYGHKFKNTDSEAAAIMERAFGAAATE